MQQNVHTIGYEGSSIEDFIATLLLAKISVLVDIRELPLSRKKGFSKNILANALDQHGIEYVHLKGLGDPKEGRDAARAGDFKKFLKIFTKHMKSEVAKMDMVEATEIAKKERACFLCFERDHETCHRNIVVKELIKNTGQKVKHLGVEEDACSHFDICPDDDYAYA